MPPDELSPESEILPPLALALIVGGAKGGLAGLLLSVLPIFAIFAGRPRGSLDMVVVALGFVFAGAGVCGLDAASSRLDARWQRWTCRFLAGAVVPIGAFAPRFGIFSGLTWQGRDALETVLGLGTFAVCLGLGVLAAGEPNTAPHRAQGCGRLSITAVAAVMAGAALLVSVVWLRSVRGPSFQGELGDLCAGVVGLGVAGLVVAGSFWIAQTFAAQLVRPLAVWLDPEGVLADDMKSAATRPELRRAEAALRAGRFDDALAALDRAEAHPSAQTLDPGLVPLRRAEVLLAAGKLDEAEAVALSARDAPAIRAEAARRRGDPEKAARLAQQWLDSVSGQTTAPPLAFPSLPPPPLVWSVRGSALGIIALARADQGRFEEAAAALASARTVHGIHPRSFEHLTVPRVSDYVQACRERSKQS